MSQYNISRVFLNNFRNIPYNSNFHDPKSINIDTIPEDTKGLFEFWNGRKVIVLDWDNGYWKTTLFLALEYLFLWKTSKQNINLSDQKWENDDNDFCETGTVEVILIIWYQ